MRLTGRGLPQYRQDHLPVRAAVIADQPRTGRGPSQLAQLGRSRSGRRSASGIESTIAVISVPISNPTKPAVRASIPADYSRAVTCYNPAVPQELPQPDLDRLSSLSALILLTYGVVRIARLPTFEAEINLAGLIIPIVINTRLVMLGLAAALATLGAGWLVRSHPRLEDGRLPYVQLVLPALAALGLGGLLTGIATGPAFWLGLPLGAAVLMLTFTAEYYAADPNDPRFGAWALVLHVLAYLLLLETFFAVRGSALRALFTVPVVFMTSAAVGWRLLSLQFDQRAKQRYALVSGWIAAQLAWALHYLPIEPLQGAIILTLVNYGTLTLLARHLSDDLDLREVLLTAGISLLGSLAVVVLS